MAIERHFFDFQYLKPKQKILKMLNKQELYSHKAFARDKVKPPFIKNGVQRRALIHRVITYQ